VASSLGAPGPRSARGPGSRRTSDASASGPRRPGAARRSLRKRPATRPPGWGLRPRTRVATGGDVRIGAGSEDPFEGSARSSRAGDGVTLLAQPADVEARRNASAGATSLARALAGCASSPFTRSKPSPEDKRFGERRWPAGGRQSVPISNGAVPIHVDLEKDRSGSQAPHSCWRAASLPRPLTAPRRRTYDALER